MKLPKKSANSSKLAEKTPLTGTYPLLWYIGRDNGAAGSDFALVAPKLPARVEPETVVTYVELQSMGR
jgi:hypothetical protein